MFRVLSDPRWGFGVLKGATDAEKGADLMLKTADLFKNNPLVRDNVQL
jgi:hypothetical protein